MRIQFCGADRTVTGSCHLVEINGLRLVLDAGMYQGRRDEARRINEYLPAEFKSIDAILLSHAHLDHCGKLPVFTRHGYAGPIYCTAATAAVARIVLEDAGEIQEENVDYLNRRSRDPREAAIQPLYRRADIPAVTRLFRRANYGQAIDLGRGVTATYLDAGHILGSAYLLLKWAENGTARSLLFTADVGRYHTPIIRDPEPVPGPVDHVITESTYGDRTHGPMAEVGPQLLDAVRWCIERRSRLLVPAFAVGRTQTMLWYFQKFIAEKLIPEIPIFVDSPMGVEVTHVTVEHTDSYDEETRDLIGKNDLFGLSRVTLATTTRDSQRINSQRGPCVIIASSPTCEFGRILHHLKVSLENPDDMIIFVGWTPPNTLGRRLQDKLPRVRIFDRWYEPKCQVRTIHGLSAHADGQELLRFLAPTLTARTSAYVVHGEPDQAETFARHLLEAGMGRATVPAMETSVVG